MTDEQWEQLIAVINGQRVDPLPVGFIIDSPWLPGWAGISTLDYYASEGMWLDANLKACSRFPEISFLPGFWSEFGMCTEPSAFGAKCTWHENDLPFADKTIADLAQVADLAAPNPACDGLAPFVLRRLQHTQARIEQQGHAIRFAVARGPLNVASFLMGTTELLMATQMNPDQVHQLLDTITAYLVDWIKLQAHTFDSIDGVLVLDDIVGFIGDNDFQTFAGPYLKRTFEAIDASVRFFHNDAAGLVCAPHLSDLGVNLFNFSHDHSLPQMRELAGDSVTLLGNIPPRDVLAAGMPHDVENAVADALHSIDDKSRLILSCGGGMPPDVSTQNIEAFLSASRAV